MTDSVHRNTETMPVHSCAVIRAAEQACFAAGCVTSDELMDYVIERLWQAVQTEPEFAARTITHVSVYAGKGNNAGDAIGLAARFSCPVTLHAVCEPSAFSAETRRQYEKLLNREVSTSASPVQNPCTLIIDGLLGSGVSGTLRPEYAAAVAELNRERASIPGSLVLAIDIPTGLQADTGELLGEAVQADVTAAIACVKPGMLADGAENYVGRLLCIPLPQVELPSEAEAVVQCSSSSALPRRPYSFFKNKAGRVNIVAGSIGYVGAAQMCAEAAQAAGAGLVALYCHEAVYPILAARVAAEVMVHPVRSYAEVSTDGAQALLIGPGLGKPLAAEARALYSLLYRFSGPIVLDADGLNTAAALGWKLPPNCILTPHPGEMRRLFPPAAHLLRAETVQRFLADTPCTLLYKGARTIIADSAHTIYNSTGGPYMANGGQGDVLAGVIGALAAQGLAPLRAAALAAHACGLAAAHAHAAAGYPTAIRATQLLPFLPQILR